MENEKEIKINIYIDNANLFLDEHYGKFSEQIDNI
jgi:hypothetical protein